MIKSDLFDSCIKKLYFTGLLIIFKKYRVPKCVVKYFFQNFIETRSAFIIIKRIEGRKSFGNPMSISKIKTSYNCFNYYARNDVFYTNVAEINKRCLVTNFKKAFICDEFSKDESFHAYNLAFYYFNIYFSSDTSDKIIKTENIQEEKKEKEDHLLAMVAFYSKMIDSTVCKEEITIPFYDFCNTKSLIEILEKYSNKLIDYITKTNKLNVIKKKITELKDEAKRIKINF